MLHLPDPAVADQLARAVELRPGIEAALLRTDLEDASRFRHRVRHLAPLRDRQRRGLLQVDMFARLDRVYGQNGVLVVGRRDDDRIDILAGQ